MSVTLNGHVYDSTDFVSYGHAASFPATGLVLFPNSIFTDMLAELAGAATILSGGISPGAAGGIAVSNGTAWVRATAATITSAGLASFGSATPISGSHLEVSAATGTATATPVVSRIRSTSNGNDWSTTTLWGVLAWYSGDSGAAGDRASIGVVMNNIQGTQQSLVLSVSDSLGVTPIERMRLDHVGGVYIGDTSNANMTAGLTINQGSNDNQILALKSSDVGHAMTAVVEADTFGAFSKAAAASGGLLIDGYKDADDNGDLALQLRGTLGETATTTKATTSIGVISLGARITDGSTGVTDVGADGNLVTIRNNTTTRFIFDAEGSAHADVEWITFDSHHDLAVIEDMETLLAPTAVQRRFGSVMRYERDFFERAGLLHDVRDVGEGRIRGMLNTTRGLMLAFGAIRQVGGMAITAIARIEALEAEAAQLRRLLAY